MTGIRGFTSRTERLPENGASKEPNGLLPEIFSDERWEQLREHLELTRRQGQVARMICRGMGQAAIARSLGVSSATVRWHSEALFKALDIHDRIGIPVRLMIADRDLPPNQVNPG